MDYDTETADSLAYKEHLTKKLDERLSECLRRAEFLISVTATGEKREHLTEANIHLMLARQAMAKIT